MAELKRNFSGSKGQKYFFWVAPTPFGAMRYGNGPRYPEEDREETERQCVETKKLTVQFED